jgi:hypothetical protein
VIRRLALPVLFLSLAACSKLGESGAPVAIEFLVPIPAAVDLGDTIQLRARVLDTNGDSIAATIRWLTSDPTLGLDSLTGRMWGDSLGTGRVQPVSGSLIGQVQTFAIRLRADSLIIPTGADSLRVKVDSDSVSAPLAPVIAKVDTLVNPVADQTLVFTLVAPTKPGIRLNGDLLSRDGASGSNGQPASPVRVRSATAVAGDTAFIRVDARRPSGAVVPGSGQVIRVFFQ